MNPFHHQPAAFVNSGPDSFIDYGQYGNEYYSQQQQHTQPIPPAPRTPIRTPVMGTRTYQHRRTLSNSSSQYSSHRGSNMDYGECLDLDYRFNNFHSIPQQTTLNVEPLKFHSVPYSVNSNSHIDSKTLSTTSNHQQIVPDRIRLYENIQNFHIHDVPHVPSPQQPQQKQQQQQIKTTHIETIHSESSKKVSTSVIAANALRREMFFNSVETSHQQQQQQQQNENIKEQNLHLKVSGSTGCTPTHSTPQDSFSDDSSYLSALSSVNRARFSPDNYLDEINATLSPTSRIAVANIQRAMAQRTIELEESEKT
jgi:hypothetical protein